MTSQEIKRYMDIYKYNQVSDCRYESDSVGTPVLWDYSKLFDLINIENT